MKRTLIIGDVHGQLDRLWALLKQEGIIDDEGHRIDHESFVIQLGDLGHFGSDHPTGDLLCWELAYKGAIDLVLWGNHDRAVIDSTHTFSGYVRPGPEVIHIMKLMAAEGRVKLAAEVDGYLVTHAGLHAQWKYQPNVSIDKDDPVAVAEYINSLPGKDDSNHAVIDAISQERNGGSPFGGILWRDVNEKLYPGFPQIFGHSAQRDHEPRVVYTSDHASWCIDIGGKSVHCLAGIWLPDQQIVRVDLND